MEFAAAIWTVRPFNMAALILALSVSGLAQQAPGLMVRVGRQRPQDQWRRGTRLARAQAQIAPKMDSRESREDMPIMIFTIAQRNASPIVSAAPFHPTELGHNRKYVFAVPPRWDYDFSEGYEEAEKILAPASLHTFAPVKLHSPPA